MLETLALLGRTMGFSFAAGINTTASGGGSTALGWQSTASGSRATVGGGDTNQALGETATVPGTEIALGKADAARLAKAARRVRPGSAVVKATSASSIS